VSGGGVDTAAPPGITLRGRIRRWLGIEPKMPEGRLLRADGRYEDCWGDCGEGGLYCCDGLWDAVRKAKP
jgi:hypothetical protein